jgi:branched-chain amino acid transport system substrate-binding protein
LTSRRIGELNVIDRKRFALAFLAAPLIAGRASAQTNASPYKIGVTFPLTGPLASSAILYIQGAEVAVAHINRAGGVNGHPLQIVAEDTQGTPQGGVSAMRKLAQVDGVQAFLTIYTNVVTAQIPLAEQLKVPFLAPAQAPNLMNKSAYSFAHGETIPATVAAFREYWRKQRIKRLFQLLPNNAVGPYYSAAIKPVAAALGAEYAEATFNYGETDHRGLAARVKDFNPDMIMLTVQGGIDDTLIIRQLRETGVNATVCLSANFYEEPAWRAGIGTYIDNLVMAGVAIDPVVGKRFIDDYRIKNGHLPSAFAGEIYDSVQMFAYAIKNSSYNGEAIAKQLAVLKGVPSVIGGTITMDSDHYSPPASALWQVRGGRQVKVQ